MLKNQFLILQGQYNFYNFSLIVLWNLAILVAEEKNVWVEKEEQIENLF